MDTKTRFSHMLSTRHCRSKDTQRLKVKGWKKIFCENENLKKSGVAILTPNKTDFKTKAITRNKERPSNPLWGTYPKTQKYFFERTCASICPLQHCFQ